MTDVIVKYYPPQVYLEIARSIFAPLKKKDSTDIPNDDVINNIIYGLISVSCVYSFMAVEAFANGLLNAIWSQAKRNHEIFLKESLKGIPLYHKFWNEYCGEGGLERAFWLPLEKKLKIITEELNIPPLQKNNPELWNDFKKLLKKSRDFIVHPKPTQPAFDSTMKSIMMENRGGVWSETASEVIKYFVKNIKKGENFPLWLEKNTLIQIHEIEYLGGHLENPLSNS